MHEGAPKLEQQPVNLSKNVENKSPDLDFLEKGIEGPRSRIQAYEENHISSRFRELKKSPEGEAHRLTELSRFVNKPMIEEMKNKVLLSENQKRILAVSSRLGRGTWASSAKDALCLDELLRKEEKDSPHAAPLVISERSEGRHHGDKGTYHYSFDSFGNTYFSPPDGSLKKLSALYGDYFNIPRIHPHTIVRNGKPHVSSEMRFLAEKGKTINQEAITAADCEKIDPQPVADPDKSFISGALFILLTGAPDGHLRQDGSFKNSVHRKDGVHYIFDLPDYIATEWGDKFSQGTYAKNQVEEVEAFLAGKSIQEQAVMCDFLRDTLVLLGSVAQAELIQRGGVKKGRYHRPDDPLDDRGLVDAIAFPKRIREVVEKEVKDPEIQVSLLSAIDQAEKILSGKS